MAFIDESVDGAAFLELSEADIKTMVKPLGHVKRILRLLSAIKPKVSAVLYVAIPSTDYTCVKCIATYC